MRGIHHDLHSAAQSVKAARTSQAPLVGRIDYLFTHCRRWIMLDNSLLFRPSHHTLASDKHNRNTAYGSVIGSVRSLPPVLRCWNRHNIPGEIAGYVLWLPASGFTMETTRWFGVLSTRRSGSVMVDWLIAPRRRCILKKTWVD